MPGYWEPHTSSIDFCEENYRFTGYVAEVLNAVSALPIAAAGPWCWCLMPERYRWWPRFWLCWAVFVFNGLGSFLFHATLQRPAQAVDELSMVLGNLVIAYCLCFPQGSRATKLAVSLSAFGALLVAIYFLGQLYEAFLFVYGGPAIYVVHRSWKLAKVSEGGPGNAKLLPYLFRLCFRCYMSGIAVWVTDNAACSLLGVGHLHIIWHALGCAGTVFFVWLLVAMTADREGLAVELGRKGIMPMIRLLPPAASGGATEGSSKKTT